MAICKFHSSYLVTFTTMANFTFGRCEKPPKCGGIEQKVALINNKQRSAIGSFNQKQ